MEEAARIAIESVRVLAPALHWVRTVRFVLHDAHALEIYERLIGTMIDPPTGEG